MFVKLRIFIAFLIAGNLLFLSHSCTIKSKAEKELEYKAQYENEQEEKDLSIEVI